MQRLLTFLIAIFMVFSGANGAKIGESVKTIQIPTTKYVRDYLSTAGKLPNLTLNNVGSFQIPTEKYVMSAIDHVNAENGNETHYADTASSNIPMDLSYFLAQTTEKLDTCPVPPWGDDKAPQTMSYDGPNVTVTHLYAAPVDGNAISISYNNEYDMFFVDRSEFDFDTQTRTYYKMYSTDGGQNWNQSNWPSDISPHSSQLSNEQHGTLVKFGTRNSSYYILYSTDGGKTWNQSNWPSDTNNYNSTIVYNEKHETLVVGASGYIMYSDDGGKTWNQSNWPSDTYADYDIVYNETYGTLVTYVSMHDSDYNYTYYMLYSTDGGVTWNESNWPSDIGYDIHNINFTYDEQYGTLVAYGMIGDWQTGYTNYVMYSTDGGVTWKQSNWPSDINYNGYYSVAYDEQHGTLVVSGQSGSYPNYTYYILYSTDGGKNWSQSNWPSDIPSRDLVYYEQHGTLVVSGQSGSYPNYTYYILYSTDGGALWNVGLEFQESDDGAGTQVVDTNDGEKLIVSLSWDYIAISDNGGKTWKLSSKIPNGPNGIPVILEHFSSLDNVIILREFDGSGIVYSHDGGQTWGTSNLPFGHYTGNKTHAYHDGILVVGQSDGWYGSECPLVYSYNGGKTWDCIHGLNEVYWALVSVIGDEFFVALTKSPNDMITKLKFEKTAHPWAVGSTCDATKTTIDDMCTDPLVGGTATCVDAKCSCVRQKLIDKSGAFVDNVAQTPVVINHTFDTQNECNALCANICADNAVNNTDGAQKAILCGK